MTTHSDGQYPLEGWMVQSQNGAHLENAVWERHLTDDQRSELERHWRTRYGPGVEIVKMTPAETEAWINAGEEMLAWKEYRERMESDDG